MMFTATFPTKLFSKSSPSKWYPICKFQCRTVLRICFGFAWYTTPFLAEDNSYRNQISKNEGYFHFLNVSWPVDNESSWTKSPNIFFDEDVNFTCNCFATWHQTSKQIGWTSSFLFISHKRFFVFSTPQRFFSKINHNPSLSHLEHDLPSWFIVLREKPLAHRSEKRFPGS